MTSTPASTPLDFTRGIMVDIRGENDHRAFLNLNDLTEDNMVKLNAVVDILTSEVTKISDHPEDAFIDLIIDKSVTSLSVSDNVVADYTVSQLADIEALINMLRGLK